MTKSERLMYILGLLKNRTAVHIADLARECSVSERTVYRDLNSLMKLGYVIQYRDGYKLNPTSDVPHPSLEAADIALINYSLRTNPLRQHPYFKRRFRIAEQKLAEMREARPEVDPFVFESAEAGGELPSNPDLIAQFLQARDASRKIRLRARDNSVNGELYTPLAVDLRDSQHIIRVADDQGHIHEWEIGLLERISLTDVPYNRTQIAGSRFENRQKQVDVR
jgi:predicted DNA-binding transcriptional regulator YafY